jgi:DNA-binding LacI/PurR family transcriptional regulator
MPITIEDIAQYLGVSVSTISKALNNYDDVSQKTKHRVLLAAQELGYHPSAAARNLRRQRTEKIGFSYGYPVTYIGEYASRLINGAVAAAEKEGYNITLYPLTESRFDQLVQISRAREVDGLLLMGGKDWHSTVDWLKQERMPFVVLVRRVDDPAVSFVAPDDVDAGMAITCHMLELGHTRIAFVTRLGLDNSEDRVDGYAQALTQAGISYDEQLVVPTEIGPGTANQAVNRLLSLPNPPTAVIGLNDPVAIECQQAVLDRGLRVPDDVAIAGSDNIRDSLAVNPAITTLHPPLAEIGRLATEALLAQIADPGRTATQIKLPVKLVVRQSTQG